MKLTKHLLILLGSYLGATFLVGSIPQWTAGIGPVGGTEGERQEIAVFAPGSETLAESDEETAEATEPGETVGNALDAAYYLRTVLPDEGALPVVGVYTPGGELLYAVEELPVVTLPEGDRERLTRGIAVYSEEELYALLQDYGA